MVKKLMDQYSWSEIVERTAIKTVNDTSKFKKWMLKKESVGYLFDYFLYSRAFTVYQKLIKDFDHVTVIVGKEGTGKSFLGLQYCSIVSTHSFGSLYVCYELKDFVKQLPYAKKGDTFLLDEGAMFLFSRESFGQENRMMVKLLTIIRQKNLHIVVCIPNFFIIDSYIRDHRVDTLINVTDRGNYTAYVGKAIKIISKIGAKTKEITGIKVPSGTFWKGYWNHTFPVVNDLNLKTYNQLKRKHLNKFIHDLDKFCKVSSADRKYLSLFEAQKELKLKRDTYVRLIKKGDLKGTKVGGKWFIDRYSLANMMEKGVKQGNSAMSYTTLKDNKVKEGKAEGGAASD